MWWNIIKQLNYIFQNIILLYGYLILKTTVTRGVDLIQDIIISIYQWAIYVGKNASHARHMTTWVFVQPTKSAP